MALVSVKIPEEDYEVLIDLKHEFRKQRKIRVTQQQLLHEAIEKGLKHHKVIGSETHKSVLKRSRKEAFEALLAAPTIKLGKNWIKDIDTIH